MAAGIPTKVPRHNAKRRNEKIRQGGVDELSAYLVSAMNVWMSFEECCACHVTTKCAEVSLATIEKSSRSECRG